MGEIVIKIPKNRRKINILRTKEEIEKEISRRRSFLESIIELKHKQEEPPEPVVEQVEEPVEPPKPEKPTFTEIFTISNTNKPTQIEFFAPPEPQIDWEQLEAELQDAYDRGFRDGQDTTRAIAEKEFEKLRQMNRIIDNMVDAFRLEYTNQMKLLKKYVVDLSITIAEQIIKYEVDRNNNFFIQNLQNILEEIDKNLIYKIFINSRDFHIFEESRSSLLTDPSVFENTKIIVDDNVEPGFCRLETSIGDFDASLRTQLENLRHHLLNESKSVDPEAEIKEIQNTYQQNTNQSDDNQFTT